MQILEKIDEGDVIIYADAGCQLNPLAVNRLQEYVDMVNNHEKGMLGFHLDIHDEYTWTKGEIFDFFRVRNNYSITHSRQLVGGIRVIRKMPETVYFYKMILSIIDTNLHLFTDFPSNTPNFLGFIENRHDQSIYSIMMKLYGGLIIPDETWPINQLDKPIWASRMRTI